MNRPKYTLTSISEDNLRFVFESIGPKGTVIKAVEYDPFDSNGIYYNLALVDIDENGEFSDNVITDNKDTDKVFVTISKTIDLFFEKYPLKRIVIFSDDSLRLRLYRMIISNYSHEKEQIWNFFGLKNNNFQKFEKGIDYEAFMITLKSNEIKL